jgi:hypothetical protein
VRLRRTLDLDAYLWVDIARMPDDATSAVWSAVLFDEPFTCAVTFGPSEEDFADLTTMDCAGAEDSGTYISEWWTLIPATERPRELVMTLSVETPDGPVGFEDRAVAVDWDRDRLENGPLCRGDLRGRVQIDPAGNATELP